MIIPGLPIRKEIRKINFSSENRRLTLTKKGFFIICESCLWMVSNIDHFSEAQKMHNKRCPACDHDLHRFTINGKYYNGELQDGP